MSTYKILTFAQKIHRRLNSIGIEATPGEVVDALKAMAGGEVKIMTHNARLYAESRRPIEEFLPEVRAIIETNEEQDSCDS